MKRYYEMMCVDFHKQLNDPLVYPIHMKDEVIKRLPKTVILTSEFDCFRKDSSTLSKRLHKFGRLHEFCVHPGLNHASPILDPSDSKFHLNFWNDWSQLIKEYPYTDFLANFRSKFHYELKGEWDADCLSMEKTVASLPRINYWIILLRRWLTPQNSWDDYWTPFFEHNEIKEVTLGGSMFHP